MLRFEGSPGCLVHSRASSVACYRRVATGELCAAGQPSATICLVPFAVVVHPTTSRVPSGGVVGCRESCGGVPVTGNLAGDESLWLPAGRPSVKARGVIFGPSPMCQCVGLGQGCVRKVQKGVFGIMLV